MTQPRDPRPTCPPEPLEISEEEYRAAEEEHEEAIILANAAVEAHTQQNTPHSFRNMQAASQILTRAMLNLADAQRRAASDHQTLMRDDPAYRRQVREREWD